MLEDAQELRKSLATSEELDKKNSPILRALSKHVGLWPDEQNSNSNLKKQENNG